MCLRFPVALLALISLPAFAQGQQGSPVKQPPSWPTAAQHTGTAPQPDDSARHSQEWSAATPQTGKARGVDTPDMEQRGREASSKEAQSTKAESTKAENKSVSNAESGNSELAPTSYTVQVAAFRDADAAKRAIEQNTVAGMRMVKTQRSGEDWYLLILGVFPTREAAEQAGATYMQANPEGSTWVRPAGSVD